MPDAATPPFGLRVDAVTVPWGHLADDLLDRRTRWCARRVSDGTLVPMGPSERHAVQRSRHDGRRCPRPAGARGRPSPWSERGWADPERPFSQRFFEALGPERCAQLEAVTIDMSGAYIKAVTETSPQATIIFDRFHVQRPAHNALDEVRREEVRKAEAADKKPLKGTRWALQKNSWSLTTLEQEKLTMLEQVNEPI